MLSINRLLPDPASLFQSVGSMGLAAAAGAGYGVVARFIAPNAGIYPLNYAVWFVVAYKIKEILNLCEEQANIFLGNETQQSDLSIQTISWADSVHQTVWKMIHIKNTLLGAIDRLFCLVLNMRPFNEVTSANVEEAAFFEMCRFRMWNVFKTTVLDFISIIGAHRLLLLARLSLPARTSVPFFLMVQTVVQNILLAPLLYKYLNFCDHLAAELDLESARIAAERARWIRDWLPSL